MFLRNHFNFGGGFEGEAEQINTIFSPSLASAIKIFDEWEPEECVGFVPSIDFEPLIVRDFGGTGIQQKRQNISQY